MVEGSFIYLEEEKVVELMLVDNVWISLVNERAGTMMSGEGTTAEVTNMQR